MNLTDVQEKDLGGPRVLPAQGKWHSGTISVAEAKQSGSGNPMIAVQTTLTGEGHEGYTLYDNFMTDGSTKGGSFSKKKLMGCGVDTSQEQSDEDVASQLLGKDIFVQVRHEAIKDKDASGNYTVVRKEDDGSGNMVIVKKAVPIAYSLYDPGSQKKEETKTAAPPAKEEKPAPAQEKEAAPASGGKPTPPWMTPKKK